MSLFIDIHRHVEGVTPNKLAESLTEESLEKRLGVTFRNYWYSEKEDTVVCLCEAPSREAALAAHREVHGPVPDEIFEVYEGTVRPSEEAIYSP
jgi:hypothetical protein